LAYATGSTGLAITVRGSSRRIMIMRFRPANIRLINRRSKLLRLLLALSSGKENATTKTSHRSRPVDTVTPYQANALDEKTLRLAIELRSEFFHCCIFAGNFTSPCSILDTFC